MMINIRRSRHEEGEKLIAIWRRSVDATHDFLSNAYRAELEELVSDFLPEAPLWVAVTDQDVAGRIYAAYRRTYGLRCFVDPDVRGQGIGKQIS
ncbi:acetyltransferase [Salmonella enterica subsp. enterica]|uniref:Acetyltransferase n=1 Tax=Salmonella enterica I TaxID=59201 RepID=A0A447PR45_SALET|nr:acetyltransferase [Salmonella enterica subsp. enterica]